MTKYRQIIWIESKDEDMKIILEIQTEVPLQFMTSAMKSQVKQKLEFSIYDIFIKN